MPARGTPGRVRWGIIGAAAETGTPLWEAFVFSFHDQMRRIRILLADGVIGELREIQSNYHFALTDPGHNIRMPAALAGGALNDVGCYPVRLARHLFAAEHHTVSAAAVWDPAASTRKPGAGSRPASRSVPPALSPTSRPAQARLSRVRRRRSGPRPGR